MHSLLACGMVDSGWVGECWGVMSAGIAKHNARASAVKTYMQEKHMPEGSDCVRGEKRGNPEVKLLAR